MGISAGRLQYTVYKGTQSDWQEASPKTDQNRRVTTTAGVKALYHSDVQPRRLALTPSKQLGMKARNPESAFTQSGPCGWRGKTGSCEPGTGTDRSGGYFPFPPPQLILLGP